MSESNAREIREDAGQASKGFGPVVTSAVRDRLSSSIQTTTSCGFDPGMQNVTAASDLLEPYDARLMRWARGSITLRMMMRNALDQLN